MCGGHMAVGSRKLSLFRTVPVPCFVVASGGQVKREGCKQLRPGESIGVCALYGVSQCCKVHSISFDVDYHAYGSMILGAPRQPQYAKDIFFSAVPAAMFAKNLDLSSVGIGHQENSAKRARESEDEASPLGTAKKKRTMTMLNLASVVVPFGRQSSPSVTIKREGAGPPQAIFAYPSNHAIPAADPQNSRQDMSERGCATLPIMIEDSDEEESIADDEPTSTGRLSKVDISPSITLAVELKYAGNTNDMTISADAQYEDLITTPVLKSVRIAWNEAHKVIVCMRCLVALKPAGVASHVSRVHKEKYASLGMKDQTIQESVGRFTDSACNMEPTLGELPVMRGVVQGLRVCHQVVCDGCHIGAANTTHLSRLHNKGEVPRCRGQHFNKNQPTQKLTRTSTPFAVKLDKPYPDVPLDACTASREMAVDAQESTGAADGPPPGQQRVVYPQPPSAESTNVESSNELYQRMLRSAIGQEEGATPDEAEFYAPLLRRTQFHVMIGQRTQQERKELQSLKHLPCKDQAAKLRGAVDSMFRKVDKFLDQSSPDAMHLHVLQLVNSKDPNTVNHTPLTMQYREATDVRYESTLCTFVSVFMHDRTKDVFPLFDRNLHENNKLSGHLDALRQAPDLVGLHNFLSEL
ncbi:hypothetical protein K525DRAFT_253449, partial [Schizophyllum commune Loenen D]